MSLDELLTPLLGLPGEIDYRVDMRGKVMPHLIEKHKDMLVLLRTQHGAHMKQSTLEALLHDIAVSQEGAWSLASEKKDWASHTARQIRSMMHDVSQALGKYKSRPKPGWLQPFVAVGDEEIEGGASSSAGSSLKRELDPEQNGVVVSPAADVDVPFSFGWDKQMQAAWRLRKGCVREYADMMEVPDDEDDELVAKWADGVTWSVPSVRGKDYNERDGKQTLTTFWKGLHVDGDMCEVKQSTAREKEWVIVWHPSAGAKKKQRLQVVVHTMDSSQKKCVTDYVCEQAKAYAKGKLSVDAMNAKKQKYLDKYASSPTVLKRPAMASTPPGDAAAEVSAPPGEVPTPPGDAAAEVAATPTGECDACDVPNIADFAPPDKWFG